MSPNGGSSAADRHPRELLAARGVRPRRALGQNFLVAPRDLDRLAQAAALRSRDVVLEVGTGLGRLTRRLAARARHVVSVELDRALHAIAAELLRDNENVTLLRCDFLSGKHRIAPPVTRAVEAALSSPAAVLRVVSNLPYSISSSAIVNLLEWDLPVRDMHVMVQREVADRLIARPGTGAYGPLSVFVGYWARVKVLFRLPPRAFWPRPEVSSSFVKIEPRRDAGKGPQYETFVAVVRRLFAGRRKTLGRLLREAWDEATARRALQALGLTPQTRPGELSVGQFTALAAEAGRPLR